MALDPHAAEMLTFLAMAFPDVGGAVLDPAEARRILGQVEFPQGPDVARVEDREIPGPVGAPAVPVRIYRPAAEGPLPVIVYFHAGGFVLCDLDSQDGTCRRLACEVGAVVVSVGYRLAPEHRFPAAVEDAYAGLRWASAQAQALGGDPARLAVAGDSSGANLAAVMCLLARELGSPSIAYQLLLYPPTDLLADLPSRRDNADGYFQTERQLRWYVDQYLEKPDQAEDWRVSPLRADSLAGLPPALILTAEYDLLRDEGEAYAARLLASGVEVTLQRARGLFHGFFGLGEFIPVAQEAEDLVLATVRAALSR